MLKILRICPVKYKTYIIKYSWKEGFIMNQEKIGKYIAKCRKEKKLTQEQLAEKLGVTNKSISRWENGKTMPDVSMFEPLCKELNISINDLLSGEKINKDNYSLSVDNLEDYIKYIKRKEKRKIFILLSGVILLIGMLTILIILASNKTFFKNFYELDFMNNISIPIPKYSYYRNTSGIEEYTTKLKTLKSSDEVNILIDKYLITLDKIECHNNIYYYDKKNDFTILQYRINNDGVGLINTIYITYSKGNYCK